jgi:transposase-like protein
MLGDAIQTVAASYGLVYPGVPYEWLERAAKETLYWSANNPNPTIAQMNEHQARIQSMCTTGEWNV